MHRIAVFMGTRPEAIKMAPVVEALEHADDMKAVVVSSGQHREMLAQVVERFGIHVDHDLEVMQPNQTLASLSARLMTSIDEFLRSDQPDLALVQGDTTTVLIAALACFYQRIPVGHVEAGLRTGNIWSPFPEEANRKLTSSIMTLYFPPTDLSQENLLRENAPANRIFVTGNTVIDALHSEVRRQQSSENRQLIDDQLNSVLGNGWKQHPMVLITGHRRENFGDGFDQICAAIRTLATQFADHWFVYPVHLNPNVQAPVFDRLGDIQNVKLIAPQDYHYFVALMNACRIILTDSGGVQEEAPSLGKPVLVMRDTTERPEGVDAGTVKLVGTDTESIVKNASTLLSSEAAYQAMSTAANPYGDGKAAPRIVKAIREFLSK